MENVKIEEKCDQEGTKRAIDQVDGDDKSINESNKKIKSETTDIKTDAVTDEKKEEINGKKEEDDEKKKVGQKINYSKKKKCVLLLSYCGSGYNGMQRNPGVRTIEEDLTNALFKARAISEDASRNYGKMSFQRCARTDKGVSAARQVVSLKISFNKHHMVPYKELLPEINKQLEPQIRVFALKQVTRGFDCKSRCSSRTYEYLLPTFAFAPNFAHTTRDFRITKEIVDELNVVLKKYEGTKNFHNFTSGKDSKEESAKRYIIRFHVAGDPFLERNMEFLVLQVQGQSFMQHQIRKMIGLVLAIMKKYTGVDAISRAFQHPKMDIPRAPGLGLVLDQVHFRSYNERFGSDGFHEPLEWSEYEDQIKKFKREYIHSQIIETEATTNSMMRWLSTLPTHSYNNEGMMDLQNNKGTNTIEEISANSKEKEKNEGEVSVNPGNKDCAVPSEADSKEKEKNEGEESVNPGNEDCAVPSETDSRENEKNEGEESVNPGNEDCAVPSETDSRENEKNEGEESVNLSNEDSTVSSEARTEMVSDT